MFPDVKCYPELYIKWSNCWKCGLNWGITQNTFPHFKTINWTCPSVQISILRCESYFIAEALIVEQGTRVESWSPLFFSALTAVVRSVKLSIGSLSNTSSNISACDWVRNLWNLHAATDSTNFAQGQRWRLILKGKSLVTCVQRGNASRQSDLPPSASDSHQRIWSLHINYSRQIWNTIERLGMEAHYLLKKTKKQ